MSAARARLLFWLALLVPALIQFASLSGRLAGDGASYYAQLRSLGRDGDIDLANEYAALGIAERPDLRVPTRTGLRRTVFPVGTALLLLPFFLAGEALARLHALAGGTPDLTGYGPWHVEAAALGGLVYGLAAVWLVESTLRRHFSARTARLVAVLVWLATFLYWYMVRQPLMSHAPSAFAAALFLWQWDRRRTPGARDALLLGFLGGLAMCVRWPNGVLLALPALDIVRSALLRTPQDRAGTRPAVIRLGLLAAAATAGALPQMLVWRAVFGTWLLAAPPQGTDFVRLARPFLLETLFSSRHGLLSWTPVLWAGFLGFVPLLRRRPSLAAPLLIPLAVLTYVNACSGDWWAGGSFSNRRFDSLLPVLAFGMAAALDALRRMARRRPLVVPATVVALAAAWNVPLVSARARGMLPADDTVAFADLVGGTSAALAGTLGSPATWPASWVFAARYPLPPDRFDTLVGRYLFYRQNNQRGCVEPGRPEYAPQLAGAWSDREETAAGPVRGLSGYGRVYVGLDEPEDLALEVRALASAPTALVVDVNGRTAGFVPAAPDATVARLFLPRALWRRDLNALGLRPQGPVQVRALRFVRARGEPPVPCGMDGP